MICRRNDASDVRRAEPGAVARRRASRAFLRNEDGSMVIFSLYALIVILIVAGMGYDLMRFETERVRMQAALDRSVLAAAAINQPLDAETVVASYFEKSGIKSYDLAIAEDRGVNYRVVSAASNVSVPTRFMRMIDRTLLLGKIHEKTANHTGQMTLDTKALSQAEERIPNVELSMVLDVSGSMGSNSRLANLKPAAKEFIHTMQCNPVDPADTAVCVVEEGRVSVSIVPYAEQVTAGADLLQHLNVTAEHNYSHCLDFSGDDFRTSQISLTDQYERTGHFDPWSYYPRDGIAARDSGFICPTAESRRISVLEDDPDTAKAKVDSFYAGGNTSIDVAMKWGTALLDPSARPVVTAMIADGDVDASYDGRPVDYHDGETIKIVVLMTDGQNTRQHRLYDQYRDGLSEFYKNTENDMYIIYRASSNSYYYPAYNGWASNPYWRQLTEGPNKGDWVNRPDEVEQLTYPQLWNEVNTDYYEEFDWLNRPQFYHGNSTKNSRLNDICSAAKANGIVVFTIAFEAPTDGQNVLRSCATSINHFYATSGPALSDAFNSIAGAIQQLKLTQ